MNSQSNAPAMNILGQRITLNWEVMAYIAILLIAIFTRFYILGDRVMSHDESLHTRFSHDLYERGDFDHTPLMHGPILFHATALSYALFGDTDFAARIYTAALGVLLVMSPLLFRRWLGRWGALLASIMLLISPLMLYYNRYIRHDTPSIFSALLMIWAIFMYLDGPPNQQRRAHWLYVIAGAMIWNLGSKETAFIYVFIIGVFLFLYWLVRVGQHFLKLPGKPVFYILMMGSFFGGVASLGMYIILDIIQFDMLSAGEEGARLFASLSSVEQSTFYLWSIMIVVATLAVIFSTLFWAYRKDMKKIPWLEVAAIIGVAVVICTGFVVIEELSHFEPISEVPITNEPGQEGVVHTTDAISTLPLIVTWVIGLAGFVFLFLTRRKPDDVDATGKDKAGRGFWGMMDLFPEFDLIIVIGTLILPWATAIIPFAMGGTSADYIAIGEALPGNIGQTLIGVAPSVSSLEQVGRVVVGTLAWLPLMGLSIGFGLMWNWKRWLVSALIFYAIFAFFFTTMFTNINGLVSGQYYSLGYWLEQQGERRGNQPQYYYLLVIMPIYEFLPVIGGIAAMFAGSTVFWKQRKDVAVRRELLTAIAASDADNDTQVNDGAAEAPPQAQEPRMYDSSDVSPSAAGVGGIYQQRRTASTMMLQDAERLLRPPFLIFFSWLAILNLVGYSLAGEKMPWLGTHLSMPLIFLTSWFMGRIISKISWKNFTQGGWIAYLLSGVLIVAGTRIVQPFFMGVAPFSGVGSAQLDATYNWFAALLVCSVIGYALVRFARQFGTRHIVEMLVVAAFTLLSVVTFRAAWMASFINYDYPTEFLVYAHAAPAVKTVLNEIEELSLRTTDGMDIRLAYDNEVSWPYSWYFRDFENAIYVGENPTVQNLDDAVVVVVGEAHRSKVEPILEDRYQRFDHMRLWWPMQDYFNLSVDRINNLFDFSSGDAAQIRQGIFEIWWARDFETYGVATGKDLSLTNWPVSEQMSFYVRKDFAVQIWNYGVGDGSIENPLDNIEENICTTNWQPLQAVAVMQAPIGMTNPIGIDVAPDGRVYVVEEFGHRVNVFDESGAFVESFGTQGGSADGLLAFQRPNSLDIAPDGRIVIADTWNYRILVLDENRELVTEWGQPGTFGFDAQQQPVDGFWGPRDVIIDEQNRIFVADTGNKRVRVYDVSEGSATWLYDIGEGGSALGQLDEPSGLAIHSDGRLFVADTWNRRISIFMGTGEFVNTFRVRGWYEEQGNRPYIALDENLDLLYVTDPDAGRVLVYNTQGECVGSFGEGVTAGPNNGQFGVTAGITVDDDGFVYVVDNEFGRVLKFEPFTFLPQVGDAEVANDGEQPLQLQPVDVEGEEEQSDALQSGVGE